jgi:hypothetical protein
MIETNTVIRTMLALFLATVLYDVLIVDWLETHPVRLPAVTAWEVVGGVMIVLVFYLLLVRSATVTGVTSFVLLLALFAVGGVPMIFGSYRRSLKSGGL